MTLQSIKSSKAVQQVRVYQNFINGKWTQSEGGSQITRKNPANAQLVARFPNSTESDTKAAIQAAKDAFESGEWPKWTPVERSRLLMKVSERLRENKNRLATMESEEVGKPIEQARGDIDSAANYFEYAGTLARQVIGESYNLNENLNALVIREPIGVIGLITPWNFPIGLLCQKLPYALAAGNTVVIKPPVFASSTTFELAKILDNVGLPKGVVNVVSGPGSVVGETLTKDNDVNKISFTGSTETGRRIIQGSSGNMKRLSLELGGKSPSIVFKDADLDYAAEGVANAIFFNQGEVCIAGSRLLVHSEIHDEFVERLVEKTNNLKIGDPLNADNQIGPLINESHLEKVLNYISIGKEEGGKIVTGGLRIEDGELKNGYYLQPTIFINVNNSMTIAREEIFGPVLSVIPFETEEEAVQIANDTPYGLSASVWTENLDKSFRIAKSLRAGTVWVNGHLNAYPELPFGGYKESGYGRELGRHGLEAFTELKTIQFHHRNN